MMLWVNFDYAATSIAHFTIIGRYGLLAISQAGQHCWPIDWPPMSFQDHFRPNRRTLRPGPLPLRSESDCRRRKG